MDYKLVGKRVGLVVMVVVIVYLAWWMTNNYDTAELLVRESGWWGPLMAIGFYVLLSLTPIPSDPLTILCGALYGWGWGFLISWMGNNAAALMEYFVSRGIRDTTKFDVRMRKLPRWLRGLPVTSLWFLIGVRMVPGFGGKVVGVMAGVWGVSWWRFLWTSAAANVVGSLGYALGGWSLVKLL